MSDQRVHHETIGRDDRERLDAYLDGLMTAEERTEFERLAKTHPGLEREIKFQQRVDTAIKATFPVPSEQTLRRLAESVESSGGHSGERSGAGGRSEGGSFVLRWRTAFAVAASLMVTVLGVWLVVRAVGPRGNFDPYAPQEFRTIAQVFHDEEADGFRPEVVCADAGEFASWFERQFGQPLQLHDPMPDGAVALGLGYSNTVSPWTIYVLMEIAGEPVIVFVDQVASDRGDRNRETGGLHVERVVIDELVLYVVSRVVSRAGSRSGLREDASRVAELFYNPGVGSAGDPGPGPGDGQETGG